jgi:hypothetical protein
MTEEHCSHSVPGRLVCNKKWMHVKNIYPEFAGGEVEGFSSGFGYVYSKYIQAFFCPGQEPEEDDSRDYKASQEKGRGGPNPFSPILGVPAPGDIRPDTLIRGN